MPLIEAGVPCPPYGPPPYSREGVDGVLSTVDNSIHHRCAVVKGLGASMPLCQWVEVQPEVPAQQLGKRLSRLIGQQVDVAKGWGVLDWRGLDHGLGTRTQRVHPLESRLGRCGMGTNGHY